MRALARTALAGYALPGAEDAPLPLIYHHENTTYRLEGVLDPQVAVPDPTYRADRFLVRVHRAGYQTVEAIRSELEWLAALRRDAGLAVPEPVRARGGALFVEASAPGVPQARVVSVLRWLPGVARGRRPGRSLFHETGALTARLHAHAARWRRSPGFVRSVADHEGLFMRNGSGGDTFDAAWAMLTPEDREVFEAVSGATRTAMARLDRRDHAMGLIHADLHLDNVLFLEGRARVIDFDDCCIGHWVFDPAVTLFDYHMREDWPALRDAYFEGYATVRAFPEGQREALPVFMAARAATLCLWALSQGLHNPEFRDFREQRLPKRVAALREWLSGTVEWSRPG